MDKMHAGQVVKVECEVVIPADATRDEVEEWLSFSLGNRGSISNKNPLVDYGAEVDGELLLSDRQIIRRYEDYDHQPQANGSVKFRRRTVETPVT